ncbi:class II fumarate hydratase [Peribacillus sp. NJ4]|uniref:class II fumarate hydratase n=1 Tax=Peribacillus TaxID=2675229 RepID=UPI0025A18850|nr:MULTISPECIES: class II fumarate hydratase [unclassified Peribacillus]MDM5213897.1 class II fumarate hydratase [Peribacillus sp. NJ4]MDM5224272.1 class II fumarate hydratase [Peribacillus sp. NJ11]
MDYRIERDTMGEVKVPADKYWGAQTERSRNNFKIGNEKMPIELVRAFAYVKQAAAKVNYDLGDLSEVKKNAIVKICGEILEGTLDEHFPLVVWQTGSGTQSNMNVNEVVANKGNEWLKENGESETLHPNDDVNKAQSSNDTFPTAMHIAAFMEVAEKLVPAIKALRDTFDSKEKEFWDVVKIGRTHLQDATPLTLGQEISGWKAMLDKDLAMIEESSQKLLNLALGGTAVGTGINTKKEFPGLSAKQIAADTGHPFVTSDNKFHALTSHNEIVYAHGALKALAADLMKIANDVRWLASGPRSGIGEIAIPENEPGSSIMPGKVNPTQSEALTMIATQIVGNDATIGFAASQGNFELNVFKPVIIYNFLQTVKLLTEGIHSFNINCAVGITANEDKIKENVDRSLMLVTALNPHIGYEKAAKIAKTAFKDNSTLKEAALKLEFLTEDEFKAWVDPADMVNK